MSNNEVFSLYAKYYDLFYSEKSYKAEADYIKTLISRFNLNSKKIIEFGCGTAAHAKLFAECEFTIHCVDISESMLDVARLKTLALPNNISNRISFEYGDIRNYRNREVYDVVLSLFHVFSYQTSNKDLVDSFRTAAKHLNSGGILIFDYWYGPGVLGDKPHTRIRRAEDDSTSLLRLAESKLIHAENRVEVDFTIFSDKDDQKEVISEKHNMRYLFINEILMMSEEYFSCEANYSWLSQNTIKDNDWYGVSILRKR
jgi:SAM-dependent methyltransferase